VNVALDELTVLIGENNSGKTSFLNALYAAIGHYVPLTPSAQQEEFVASLGSLHDGHIHFLSKCNLHRQAVWIPLGHELFAPKPIEKLALRYANL
jgi:predicted ATP-dependent endonuclease of OLD family